MYILYIAYERQMSDVIISMAGDEIMTPEDWRAIITPLWDHYPDLLVPGSNTPSSKSKSQQLAMHGF